MLPLTAYTSYADAQRHFAPERLWELFDGNRERLNIAHECIDRHAADGRVAVRIAHADGRTEDLSFAAIAAGSARFAHYLAAQGIGPGDRVAIKTNLTGGVKSGRLPGVEPVESFVTHPEVVRALVKQVKLAGAKEIFIVEAVYEWESYRAWGYEAIADDLGATLIDLNDSRPYADFVEAPVSADSSIYPSFIFNKILQEVDVFMSVSKMKNHYLAGVTHTMKNLYGLVPYRFYRLNEDDNYRSGFHGTGTQTQGRLPRIIVDLNRARPIQFSLVDGIKTTQGGEGPWIATLAPIEPGVLVAGKNCVATDAVATAVMGHDPAGDYPEAPYLRCDNHLNLAAAAGLGPNRLEAIEVLGVPIDRVKTQFKPAGS